MFGFITDAIKHAHDQSIGRVQDIWQTNYLDRKIQNRTAALNKNLWAYQMNNSYQLTVDDMRKAGLNPMLMMSNGATQAGGHASSASGYNGRKDSSWMPSQSLVASKQLDVLNSQEKKNEADAKLANANASSVTENNRLAKAINDVILSKEPFKVIKALGGSLPSNAIQALEMMASVMMAGKNGNKTPISQRPGTD